MGIEKKAALVCVVVLAALFGIGLASSEEKKNTETAKARSSQELERPSGFILPEPGNSPPAENGKKQSRKEAKVEDQPAPQNTEFREVIVRARDNYTKIAARELGNRNLHPLITAANPGVDPRRLKIGQKILVPVEAGSIADVDVLRDRAPALGGLEYTIKKGESLSTIANRVYGKESRWRDIWAANRSVISNPNRVRSGIKILLP